VDRFGWLSLMADPTLVLATVVAAGLPVLLLPATVGPLLSAAVVVVALWLNHRMEGSVRHLPIQVGVEAMVGQIALVVEPLGPVGTVRCGGELWRATEVHGRSMERGRRARVLGAHGLVLRVERIG